MEDHSEMRALGQRLVDDHAALLDAFERSGGLAVEVQTETGEYFCTCYFDADDTKRFRAAVGPTENWEQDFQTFFLRAITRGILEEGQNELSGQADRSVEGQEPNEG